MIKKLLWMIIILTTYTYMVYTDADKRLPDKTKSFVQNYYKNLKKMKIKVKINTLDI